MIRRASPTFTKSSPAQRLDQAVETMLDSYGAAPPADAVAPDRRRVVVARFVEQKSIGDIARELGRSLGQRS